MKGEPGTPERDAASKLFHARRRKVFKILSKYKVIIPPLQKYLAAEFDCSITAIYTDTVEFYRSGKENPYPTISTRKHVFDRDKRTCQYCGEKADSVITEHVIPSIIGGNGMPYNIVCACHSCNTKKKGSNVWVPMNFDVLKALNPDWAEKILDQAVKDFRRTA